MERTKRLLEILSASLLLIIFFIPSIIICIVVYIQTEQFPIFVQIRGITLNKNIFQIYKFRTLKDVIKSINLDGYGYSRNYEVGEKEMYPFGRFLRETGLDEIPQLINIIKGEMTFIGPRPLDKKDLRKFREINETDYGKREEINLKPGITGWWQISRNHESGLKYLIESDEYYAEHKSLIFDVSIILKTIHLSFSRGNKENSPISTNSIKLFTTGISSNLKGQMN